MHDGNQKCSWFGFPANMDRVTAVDFYRDPSPLRRCCRQKSYCSGFHPETAFHSAFLQNFDQPWPWWRFSLPHRGQSSKLDFFSFFQHKNPTSILLSAADFLIPRSFPRWSCVPLITTHGDISLACSEGQCTFCLIPANNSWIFVSNYSISRSVLISSWMERSIRLTQILLTSVGSDVATKGDYFSKYTPELPESDLVTCLTKCVHHFFVLRTSHVPKL